MCVISPLAKQRCLSFSSSETVFDCIFDFIHCDLWGPFSISSLNGSRFFLTIVDDFSRSTWVYLLQNKAQAQSYLQFFFQLVDTQFKSKIKKIRLDNRVEFLMPEDFSSRGVIHKKSCVKKSQKNGFCERKHQYF